MRRRLLLLNLLLLAMGAAAAWQVRVRYLAGEAEERRLLRPQAKTTQKIPVSPLPAPPPAQAALYGDVAQKMLFTQDQDVIETRLRVCGRSPRTVHKSHSPWARGRAFSQPQWRCRRRPA